MDKIGAEGYEMALCENPRNLRRVHISILKGYKELDLDLVVLGRGKKR